LHQARDDIIHCDRADGAPVLIEHGEHAEIVFVEEVKNVFFTGIGGRADERIGLEVTHEAP